jgi:hypothetical protein
VENNSRVLKVIKTPVDSLAALPDIFKSVLGYDFYTLEEGKPLELDPEYGTKFKEDYQQKVAVLAWDAAALIRTLEAEVPSGAQDPVASASAKPKIYLAECSADRRDTREKLIADLKESGEDSLVDITWVPLIYTKITSFRASEPAYPEGYTLSSFGGVGPLFCIGWSMEHVVTENAGFVESEDDLWAGWTLLYRGHESRIATPSLPASRRPRNPVVWRSSET